MREPATRLILVRHGLVEAAWRGRLYGCKDVALAPEGRLEAERAAARLADETLDAVVSSGLARTEFGAALLRAGRALARRDEPELREIERGAWVGLRPEEVPDDGWHWWHAEPRTRRPPDGESLEDLRARVLPRLEALAREHAGGTLAIVAHSWVLRVAACHALGLTLDAAPRLSVPTGSMLIVDGVAQAFALEPTDARPVLAALGSERVPARGPGWFRGPRR